MINKLVLGLGCLCLALITLIYPATTRMFASPWILAQAVVLSIPAGLLMVRAFDAKTPLVFPSVHWTTVAAVSGILVFASALTSPYRSPSLLWSAPLLSAITAHILIFDWLHREPVHLPVRQNRLHIAMLAAGLIIALVSLTQWLEGLSRGSLEDLLGARNPYPLGHPNYTAGVAILLLPLAANSARRAQKCRRIMAIAGVGVALVLLFASGSRGGLIGVAAMAALALSLAPLSRGKKLQITATIAVLGIGFAFAHPRTRASLLGDGNSKLVAASSVQRRAMLIAGTRMGAERPLLGWGPGTTPLVYPKFRGGLDGGADTVLQLHSTPVQLWAELGLAGMACFCFLVGGVLRNAYRDPVAAITLGGYGAFSFTDWQLDIPLFAFAVAGCAASLAPPAKESRAGGGGTRTPWLAGGLVALIATAIALFGRRDPTPALNARALTVAVSPARAGEAIALLRHSLNFNPDQEIAHFNLGWLLVVSAPAEAESHFISAARLVPDKGGVYFGLALARLNQGRIAAAAHALALECLNDPQFFHSRWWQEPAIAALREPTAAAFVRHVERARATVSTSLAKQLEFLASRVSQLGLVHPGSGKTYRRERIGYPVLMRNLDIPTPIDLFDVREPASPDPSLPAKGWLPSPVLLTLLDTP